MKLIPKLSNNQLLIVVIVVVLVFVYYVYTQRMGWEHTDAVAILQVETGKWGAPSILVKSKGGLAIWTREQLSNTCFECIELYDESVSHCVPLPHRDFLYTFIKYDVSPETFADVLSLSGSVSYDPLKKLLRARCGSQEANIATLYLATEIASGKQNIQNIQKEELYKQTIISTKNPETVKELYNKLCQNVDNQPGNPNFTGFWPAAFPEGCCDGYNPNTNTCG